MKEIICRHPGNPVLQASDIPYPATLIFNAGVAKWQGKYVMAFRNDYGGSQGSSRFEGTNIGVAMSDDGIAWQPRPAPWIEWKDDEIRRAYDPRITIVDGRCYLCFAVDTAHGVRGGIAVTDDFDQWEVLEGLCERPLMTPETQYEREGFRGHVLFPGGLILEDHGEVKIYYGAADTVECLATAHVDDLIALCNG